MKLIPPILSNENFCGWFIKNEKTFLRQLKINQLREGIVYLTGMIDENTVELVLTADGAVKTSFL